ncbi:spore coat polysaccharide biosynthesis protein SpsF (cytidylyltransferase family) [Bradyrhizobium sp. i1.3.1]
MSTTPSGNHESPKSKILKRKKARSNTPLSCKIEYYIKTNSAYFSDQSAFFTDDYVDARDKPGHDDYRWIARRIYARLNRRYVVLRPSRVAFRP